MIFVAAALLLTALAAQADDGKPAATPYRPSVSTPAQLSAPGWQAVAGFTWVAARLFWARPASGGIVGRKNEPTWVGSVWNRKAYASTCKRRLTTMPALMRLAVLEQSNETPGRYGGVIGLDRPEPGARGHGLELQLLGRQASGSGYLAAAGPRGRKSMTSQKAA